VGKGTTVKGTKNRKKNQDCNMFWEVEDPKTNEKFMLMEVYNNEDQINNYTKCSLDKVKDVLKVADYRPVYYVKKDGQVAFTQPKGKGSVRIPGLNYMSQIILKHYGDNKVKNARIVFKNGDKLDNRTENLIIKNPNSKTTEKVAKVVVKVAETKADEVKTKNFPKELENIIDELPPYVLYCNDKSRNSKYFRIEKNPNFVDKEGKYRRWKSTEKKSVSVPDKYKETIKILNYVNEHHDLPSQEKTLPKYVSKKYNTKRKCDCFIFYILIIVDGKKKHLTLTYKITDPDNEIEEYDVFRFKVRTRHKVELEPLC